MNITPVSFRGLKEIHALAKKQDTLTRKEQDLYEKAQEYSKIEVETTSDGDYCWGKDLETADKFATALQGFRKEPSRFAFLVGVDVLKDSTAEIAKIESSVKASTIEIGRKCPDITKEDIIENLDVLA